MSATEPTSIALARNASRVLGPPLMLAHSTSNVQLVDRSPESLEGDLGGRVADPQDGAVRHLVGHGGRQLEARALRLGAAAHEAGQGEDEAGDGDEARGEARAPRTDGGVHVFSS